jgi:hypothetical protein
MTETTTTITDEIRSAVFAQARGSYQRGLLSGDQRWSGADLRGRASKWSTRYACSRGSLEARIRGALFPLGWSADTRISREHRGMRRLVLTSPSGEVFDWLSKEPLDTAPPREQLVRMLEAEVAKAAADLRALVAAATLRIDCEVAA